MSSYETVGAISLKGISRWHFEWTIPDILSYTKVNECIGSSYASSLRSPRFIIPGSEWCLMMFPYGRAEDKTEGNIGLYLYRVKDSLPTRHAKFTLGVKTSRGKIGKEVDLSYTFGFSEESKDGWGLPNITQRSGLIRKDELAPFDVLTVTCRLTLSDDLDDGTAKLVRLSEDLKEMLIAEKSSDATIRVGDTTFAVHRSILQSRSPVFAAMFETDMIEKETNVVEIVDCDPVAFGDLLLYLYSGTTEELPQNVYELYKICDKYDVQELKSECLDFVVDNLNCENLFDAVLLAHQFDEKQLEHKTQVFFNENFQSIAPGGKWGDFLIKYLSLAKEMLVKMSKGTPNRKC